MSATKSKQTLRDRYSSSDSKAKRQKNKFFQPGVFVLISVTVILGVVFVAFMLKGGSSGTVGSYNLVVTPDNIEELLAENPSKVAAGSYDVSMNTTWRFKDAHSASDNAYVANLISNTNTVNFTLSRNDTDEVIYESPYIPVGSSLKNIKLSDESMGKGTYPCTVTYHLVDEDYNELSTLRINVSLVIESD